MFSLYVKALFKVLPYTGKHQPNHYYNNYLTGEEHRFKVTKNLE